VARRRSGCQTIILTLDPERRGIILEENLWRGSDGTGRDWTHQRVPIGGAECNAVGIGVLEVYASATAIVRLTREGLQIIAVDLARYA